MYDEQQINRWVATVAKERSTVPFTVAWLFWYFYGLLDH